MARKRGRDRDEPLPYTAISIVSPGCGLWNEVASATTERTAATVASQSCVTAKIVPPPLNRGKGCFGVSSLKINPA